MADTTITMIAKYVIVTIGGSLTSIIHVQAQSSKYLQLIISLTISSGTC